MVLTTAAVLWCAFVITTTFLPGGPRWTPIAVYLPGFLVLPVFLHTLLRARSTALFCLAHVPVPVLVPGIAAVLGGWLFAWGLVAGEPGTESLSGIAGLVIVLHAAFGLIAVGMVRTGR